MRHTTVATGLSRKVNAADWDAEHLLTHCTVADLGSPTPTGRVRFVTDALQVDGVTLGVPAISTALGWLSLSMGPTPSVIPPFYITSLFDASEDGAIYEVSTAYLFQDNKGVTPVTGAGQSVGLLVPANENNGAAETLTPSAFGTGWVYDAGTGVATGTAAEDKFRWTFNNDVNLRYVVDCVITVTSGSLTVEVGAAGGAFTATITAGGSYKLHLRSGGSSPAGVRFFANTFTGTVKVNSVKAESKWALIQETDANRPVYGVDPRGIPVINCAGGKSLVSYLVHTVSAPTYMALGMSRATATATGYFGYFGVVGVAGTTSYALGVSSADGGSIINVDTRTASAPLNQPLALDLNLAIGTTSVFQSGGERDVPDSVGLQAGELRTVANTWDGSEGPGAFLTIQEVSFYGGIVRKAATTLTQRRNVAGYLQDLTGLAVLDTRTYDIFVIAGQSNAMGVGNQADSTLVPFGNGVEYIDSGFLKPMADPVQGAWPSQGSLTGSAWPAFCARYFNTTGNRAAIVGTAFSGEGLLNTSIPDGGWLTGEYLTDILANKLARAQEDVNGTVKGVIYYGGENDSTLTFTVAEYKTHLVNFLAKLRTKTGIADLKLLLISLDNATGSPPAYAIMRQAMADAAAENDGIELIVPYQNYLGMGGAYNDGIHLQQIALNDLGAKAADGVVALGL